MSTARMKERATKKRIEKSKKKYPNGPPLFWMIDGMKPNRVAKFPWAFSKPTAVITD